MDDPYVKILVGLLACLAFFAGGVAFQLALDTNQCRSAQHDAA